MASRRMKMKVAVNIGRGGGVRSTASPKLTPLDVPAKEVVPEDSRSNSPLVRSSSPIKSPAPIIRSSSSVKSVTTTTSSDDESQSAPGTSPPVPQSRQIANNIQKEFSSVHHVSGNETLTQLLQKGMGSSSKYSTLRKEFHTTNKNKTLEKKDLTILHFTFWNPPPKDENSFEGEEVNDAVNSAIGTTLAGSPVSSPSEQEVVETEAPIKPHGPRVKVGPDGELILDERSLVVETSESVRAKKQLADMETVMAETSGFYRHKMMSKRGTDWSIKETLKFYKALTMCGTDFSMMAHLFPKRTRTELKAKFKREDRKNMALVSQALACQSFNPTESMSESDECNDEPLPKKRRRSSTKEKVDQIIQSGGISENVEESPPVTENNDTVLPKETIQNVLPVDSPPLQKNQTKKLKTTKKARRPKEKPLKLPVKMKLGRPTGIGQKLRKEIITKGQNTSLSDLDNKSKGCKVVKGKNRRPLRKLKKKKEKVCQEEGDMVEGNQAQEIEEEELTEISNQEFNSILRFDASDPLGLKVVQPIPVIASGEEGSAGVLLLEAPLLHNVEEQIFILPEDFPLSYVVKEKEKSPPSTPLLLPEREGKPSRRRMTKVRPRVPRIPGGGDRVGGASPVSGNRGDEIEIEISCL